MRCPAAPDRTTRIRAHRRIRTAVLPPRDAAAPRPEATADPVRRFRAPSPPSPTARPVSVHPSHRPSDAPTFRRLTRRTLWTDPLTEAAPPPSSPPPTSRVGSGPGKPAAKLVGRLAGDKTDSQVSRAANQHTPNRRRRINRMGSSPLRISRAASSKVASSRALNSRVASQAIQDTRAPKATSATSLSRASRTPNRISLSTNPHTVSPRRAVRSRTRVRTDRTVQARLPLEPEQRQAPEPRRPVPAPTTPDPTLSRQVPPAIQQVPATRTPPGTRTLRTNRMDPANQAVRANQADRVSRTPPASKPVPTPMRRHPVPDPIPLNSLPSVLSPDRELPAGPVDHTGRTGSVRTELSSRLGERRKDPVGARRSRSDWWPPSSVGLSRSAETMRSRRCRMRNRARLPRRRSRLPTGRRSQRRARTV